MQPKIGTIRVTFFSEHICMNQPQDAPALVAEGGPQIPARHFAGAWTSYVTAKGLSGDNGVFFHDALPVDAIVEILTRWSQLNNTAFQEPIVWGTFQLDIDVFDWKQCLPVQMFLKAMDDAYIRIGGRRNVHGRCEVRKIEWIQNGQMHKSMPKPTVPLTVPKRSVYYCFYDHPQTATIRLQGGKCPRCGAEVEPQWYVEANFGSRPRRGIPRLWDDQTLLMETVEEILNLHLGLELPVDIGRMYLPPRGNSIEFDVLHVSNRALRMLGLPKLPWELSTCPQWRSRLDVLVGLGIIFKAQGADEVTAITCAAVIHRLLTNFRLTAENGGEWWAGVDEARAETVYQNVWRYIALVSGRTPSFQEITGWCIGEFGLRHTSSLEYGRFLTVPQQKIEPAPIRQEQKGLRRDVLYAKLAWNFFREHVELMDVSVLRAIQQAQRSAGSGSINLFLINLKAQSVSRKQPQRALRRLIERLEQMVNHEPHFNVDAWISYLIQLIYENKTLDEIATTAKQNGYVVFLQNLSLFQHLGWYSVELEDKSVIQFAFGQPLRMISARLVIAAQFEELYGFSPLNPPIPQVPEWTPRYAR